MKKSAFIRNLKLSLMLIAILLATTSAFTTNSWSWSNGGYSSDPANPDYGTHDWIAEHALDWLPTEEKQYILDNLAAYLYGTELPDSSQAPDGIGDTTKHHIYFSSADSLTDDAAAARALTEYNNALNSLKSKDYTDAAKTAGIMSHYIVDMAVFGHVMGSGTDWGAEVHHSAYETYVNTEPQATPHNSIGISPSTAASKQSLHMTLQKNSRTTPHLTLTEPSHALGWTKTTTGTIKHSRTGEENP